jgi:alkylhydroperoxidase/carboxymuconolactone decarboxylase family protein YurZ
MSPPQITNIRDYLPLPKVMVLQNAYVRDDAMSLLNSVLPLTYDYATEYVTAVGDAFFGDLPEDTGPMWRSTLSIQDRERCVITLLASQRAVLELAIHVYLAVMEGLSPEEVANILMLTGMYAGLDSFSHGLRVEAKALATLAALVDDQTAVRDAYHVLVALKNAFEPTGP